MSNLLIDCAWLSEHLHSDDVVIVDCRFSLADPQSGRRAYLAGHVPGAVYADLETDLSSRTTAVSGRHPLPDPDTLAARFGTWGIDADTRVVIYDDMGGAMAARFWWLARWLGHPRAMLLDGGWQAWKASGRAIEAGQAVSSPRVFRARLHDELAVTADTVRAGLGGDDQVLVDARARSRFAGEEEPIDRVAGHVPGALNRPFVENLDPEGRFLSPDSLRAAFRKLIGEKDPASVTHMCGSGVTACHNLFAMELAGLSGSRLYPGSWSEWIRDPARPVTTGSP